MSAEAAMEVESTEPVCQKPVKFEVTVREATGASPFKDVDLANRRTSPTKIKLKLDQAEERRLSLKNQVQEQAASKLKKVQEKTQRAQEEKENWQRKVGQELAADLETKEINRQQLLEQKRTKFSQRLAAHARKVEEMNAVYEAARKELSSRIDADMALAEDRRNKHLDQLQDKFKEHGVKIAEVRKNAEDAQAAQAGQIEEKHLEKLENGLRNRQEQLNVLVERLKEHSVHIETVRQKKQSSD